MATANATALLDADFRFDGNTSDLAQQFYLRYQANDTSAPQLAYLTDTTLPTAIQSRLTAAGVAFADLPALLQRALIWDSGYAIGPSNELVRVLTLDGVSMAEIAVPITDYRDRVGCTVQNCTQPDGLEWFKSNECNGAQMNSISRCLVDDFDGGTEIHLSMWSTGGDESAVPEMKLYKHVWEDGNNSYSVPAIHTGGVYEAAYGSCVSEGDDIWAEGYGAIVIACYPQNKISTSMKAMMQAPAQGKIVTAWLAEVSASANGGADSSNNNGSASSSKSSGFNAVLLVPIVIAVLVIAGLIFWLCRRKRRSAEGSKPHGESPGVNPAALISPARGAAQCGDQYKETGTNTGTAGHTASSQGKASIHTAEEYDSGASSSVMKILLADPFLVGRQLAFDQIQFDRLLSKGAFGEVWVCQYESETVAVKRLLQNKQHSFEEVEDFTREIQLSASLQHPNIVSFIGVAWNSLENLVMAIEYLPSGDLQQYLRANGDLLSWPREKIVMARGLASALEYMHARSPALIHRDLKSKNVLLSDRLEAKLIDFGVSKGKKDQTMTAGVGTPFWTAPEVLEGTRYTEKSDIYSFGVLLTELDTCKIPYHDAQGKDGEKLKHFQILNSVMAGTLRPSCSEFCPDRIRRVVAACLQHDAATRPTATELVQMLDGN